MTVITLDPLADDRWRGFVHGNPDATIFHHPAWLSLLEAAYGYRPMAQVAVEGDLILGGLPLLEVRSRLTGTRGVALPFCDFCPPLANSPEVLEQVLGSLESLRAERGWKYLEVRDTLDHPGLQTSQEFRAHVLSLSGDPDAVFKTFKKTQTQQSIFRGVREGLRVERRTDEAALREFIRLNAITRRKHGIPPQPDRFFHLLREMILEPGYGFISLAIHNGLTIGSSVYLYFGQTVIYKYGASTAEFLSLRPNHAVMWDAIRWSIEQGYTKFHFGRTDLSNEGLLRFKRGWGTVEVPLRYVRAGGNVTRVRSEGKIAGVAHAVVGKTPIPILKAVGRILYRHMG